MAKKIKLKQEVKLKAKATKLRPEIKINGKQAKLDYLNRYIKNVRTS
jgi:hypothetical protein